MSDRVLIALQGKHPDDIAVQHATVLAKHESSHITPLRIYTPGYDMEGGIKQLLVEEGSKGWHIENEAEASLAALKQSLQTEGVSAEAGRPRSLPMIVVLVNQY